MLEDYEEVEFSHCDDPWLYYPVHLNSSKCWCVPVLDYEDAETGNQVWVHNEIQ